MIAHTRDLRDRLHDKHREDALNMLNHLDFLKKEIEHLLEDGSVEAECDFMVQIPLPVSQRNIEESGKKGSYRYPGRL